jgi:protein disulfide-isomerase A1
MRFISTIGLLAPTVSAMQQLTAADFGDFLTTNKRALVSFVAPWCGHCKELLPLLEGAAQQLSSIGVAAAKIDATEETELASQFKVDGYPTIVYITENNAPVKYKGKRDAESILKWVEGRNQPATVSGSADDAKRASEGREKIAYFGSFPTDEAFKAFERAASAHQSDEKIFFVSRESPQRLEIYRDSRLANSAGDVSADAIHTWIEREQIPLFGEINSENYDVYESSASNGVAFLWVCVNPKNKREQILALTPAVEALAKQFRANFNFVWIDSEQFGPEMLEQIGCSSTDFPGLVVHETPESGQGLRRYRLIFEKNEFDSATAASFLKRVVDRKEPVFFRSKAASSLEAGYVTEISSKQALAHLSPATADSLLLVSITQSSLCPECNVAHSSLVLMKALAETQAGAGSLHALWIDGMENDPPSELLEWDNVPNMLFVPAGSTEASKFPGPSYTPDAIAEWFTKLSANHAIKSLDYSEARLHALPGNTKDANLSEVLRIALEQLSGEVDLGDFGDNQHGEEL